MHQIASRLIAILSQKHTKKFSYHIEILIFNHKNNQKKVIFHKKKH